MHERRETSGFPYVSLKGTEAGESILYKRKGRYYLDVIGANDDWPIVIGEHG